MKLSNFEFELPQELIAKHPSPKRDEARLMVVNRKDDTISHYHFKDIVKLFKARDVIVLNSSGVLASQLYGVRDRTDDKVGVFLVRELEGDNFIWDSYFNLSRKIRDGNKFIFEEGLIAEVLNNTGSRERTIKFNFDGTREELREKINRLGHPPIPVEILERTEEDMDKERYQTVYAEDFGGAIPPFAGFHFDRHQLLYLEVKKNILFPKVTMHIGFQAFQPLNAEDLTKCHSHGEYYSIPQETADVVNRARSEGKKVCAVGTSTLKTLESSIDYNGNLRAGSGYSYKFINPPYTPLIPDALITNFHLPKSKDFINSLGFIGHELGMEVYKTAIYEEYKFFVYGDALLIL